MLILGVETSCDDTGVGIVCTDSRTILSNKVSSQFNLHEQYGGIMPLVAARAHDTNLPLVLQAAFDETGLSWKNIDAVAVTRGPGLRPCLRAGLKVVENIGIEYPHLQLVEIHHLEGHALISRIFTESYCKFPYLTLIASGGHTSLVMVNDIGDYTLMGSTQDDAVGEAFDKVGRLLGLSGSSCHLGAALEKVAVYGNYRKAELPVPMSRSDSVDFSFSGLKSAVARRCNMSLANPQDSLSRKQVHNIAAGFQYAAVKHLVGKTRRALVWSGRTVNPQAIISSNLYKKIEKDKVKMEKHFRRNAFKRPNALVVAGGVAANMFLRDKMNQLGHIFNIPVLYPPVHLCTDNGAMIAWAGAEILQSPSAETFKARMSKTFLEDPKLPLDFRKNVN